MRTIKVWSPLIALAIALAVGRWLATPDPSVGVYWNWLMYGGAALGVVDGLWGGSLLARELDSWVTAILAGAGVALVLGLFQLVAYGVFLPDALAMPPGQVPQDDFAAWLLGGIGLFPAAAVVGRGAGWWFWWHR